MKLTKEILEHEYLTLKLDRTQIAKKYNLKNGAVSYALKKHNIPIRKSRAGGRNLIDLKGKRFGRLVVLEEAPNPRKNGKEAYWKCKCDCGKIKNICGGSLRKELTTSCGCYHFETVYEGCGDLCKVFWYGIIRHAKSRKIPVEITIKDAWEIFLKQDKKCALSGKDIKLVPNVSKNRKENTASLDRINSDKGYTIDNVQWVHKDLNIMKNKYDMDTFVQYCKDIVEHQNKKLEKGSRI